MSVTRRLIKERDSETIQRLTEFSLRCRVGSFPRALIHKLLERISTSPMCTIELVDDDETVAVAVIVDAISNASGLAILDIIAMDPAIQKSEALRLILSEAESSLRRIKTKPGLEAPIRQPLAECSDVLAQQGFSFAFSNYEMETTPHAPLPEVVPAPRGFTWEVANEQHARSYYEAVSAAMLPVPGGTVGSFEEIRGVLGTDSNRYVLMDQGTVAGFLTLRVEPERRFGYVQLLGRHPSYRGRGLGPVLLTEGMAKLRAQGADYFALDVTATNESALSLYKRFGFEVVAESPTYAKRFEAA
ncbi:MAG: GNAT family N-acetyltransferase [Myxococcales bacterium]|nr:GNAT family N-acetyltransferase [Myxococcales bacterium]